MNSLFGNIPWVM